MNGKIRVLQVVPSLCSGGAERMVLHLATGLDRSRYEASVACLSDPLGTDIELAARDADVPVHYLGKKAGFDARAYPRLDRVMRDVSPSVVHIHLNALLYAAPVSACRGVRAIVYTAHNFPELLVPPALRWFYRTCFHWGVVPVSIAGTLTPALRKEFHVKSIPLIPNGIPVAGFNRTNAADADWRHREGFADRDFLFVCVARLSPQKNHDLLLRAFRALREMGGDAHLLLAGDGELRGKLMKLTEGLDIVSRVHFLGNRADIATLLGASDVFVLSSTQEANPLCVMEAMAAGLPIVSTRVGGVPDIVDSRVHGLLTDPGGVASLAQAMSVMMLTPRLRQECGRRAAERAQDRFDLSRMVDAYDQLYCSLLDVTSESVGEMPNCPIQSELHI